MDSYEWNKIFGAVLFALLLAVGLSIFSEIIFESEAPETPGYVVAVATEGGAAAEEEATQPIGVRLASADPSAGEAVARKCVACHTFGAGEANKVGPNLWSMVGQQIAAHEGYAYSDAMKAHAEEAGTWSYEHLDSYLTAPTDVVPGTKMVFPGVKDDADRANVIAYLRTLSDDPPPLPEPEEAGAAEPEEADAAEPEDETTEHAAATPEEEPAAEAEAAMQESESATEEPADGPSAVEEPAPEQQTAQTEEAEEPAGEEQQVAADEETEEPAAEEQQVAAAEETATEMPAGDPAKGEAFAKRCVACHTFEEGGAKKVGPPLFGILDRPIASVSDFSYSDAMVAFSEDGSKTWDAETLDTYLADPRGVVPGSKMIFPGVKKEEDRANIIAYLATLKP